MSETGWMRCDDGMDCCIVGAELLLFDVLLFCPDRPTDRPLVPPQPRTSRWIAVQPIHSVNVGLYLPLRRRLDSGEGNRDRHCDREFLSDPPPPPPSATAIGQLTNSMKRTTTTTTTHWPGRVAGGQSRIRVLIFVSPKQKTLARQRCLAQRLFRQEEVEVDCWDNWK